MNGILKKFISLYHPYAARSFVYLLQTSEYYLHDFFLACIRIKKFTNIERRGNLSSTPKALVLLTLLYSTQCALLCGVILLVFNSHFIFAIGLLLLTPFFTITVAIAFIACLKPLEFVVIKYYIHKATVKLSKHPGTVIAIAGSYGKTTTRNILSTVLNGKLTVATPIKNHNTPLAIAKFIDSLQGTEDIIIVECGEYYRGDVQMLVRMLQPDIGIITGINEAHLSRFGTIETTTETIFELADEMVGKPVYVNIDDTYVAAHATKEHIQYSNAGVGSKTCSIISSDLSGQDFFIQNNEKTVPFRTKCIGPHLIGTMSLAIEIARTFNIEDISIQTKLGSLTNPPHRFELRNLPNNIQIIDDSYNGNPTGVKAMLEFLKTIQQKRIVYITPGLVELGTATVEVHVQIADQLALLTIADIVLVATPATEIIKARLEAQHYTGQVTVVTAMTDILSNLNAFTIPGDLVVIQNDWGDHYI